MVAGAAAAIAAAAVILVLILGQGDSGTRGARTGHVRSPGGAGTARTQRPVGPPIAGTKLTVYSSLPEQGAAAAEVSAVEDGIRLAIEDVGGSVGRYSIDYVPLDDSLASSGAADAGQTAANARKAASDGTTIGYIGEYNSSVSKVSIPILNGAGIAQISPSNTSVGLTSNKPGRETGEPDKYYPTGKRTYARIVPNDAVQARVLVEAAKRDGCSAVHVFNSGTPTSAGLATNIGLAAPKAGVKVEGSDAFDPRASGYRSLASSVRAPCVIQTGEIDQNGVQVLRDVGTVNPGVKLYGSDGICLDISADPASGIPAKLAPRFKCTMAALAPQAFGPAAQRFFAHYSARFKAEVPDPYAIYGYESMALLLDAIKRATTAAGVSRDATVAELFRTTNRRSVIGTYSIDRNGDTSLTDYALYKIVSGQLVFDRVIHAPAA